MSSFFQSPLGFYISTAVFNLLLTFAIYFIHTLTKNAEQKAHSSSEGQSVNQILDVIDKLTESAVLNANSLIVDRLKQQNLFTQKVAESVKKSVTNEIMTNMGTLKDATGNYLGPLENIISHLIEKHVTLSKQKMGSPTIQNANIN